VNVRALDPSSWPDFAARVERHNGVWGGCWCMGFHPEGVGRHKTPAINRAEKEERVRSGRAHAALVYDGDECVGWCQFGAPDELPRIKHRRAYEAGAPMPPDWRITCFFVATDHRRVGVADAALGGALELIAGLGGGVVESYPEDIGDRAKVSSSFLHNGALSMFERHGFERVRRLGKHHWVVMRTVMPCAPSPVTARS
jgi:ribosomal protein S18 acetylase RimI-like enzyme